MDVNLTKPPFALNGVHWSTANRWIIGTCARATIVTPHVTMAGHLLTKREVVAAVESTQNLEAICVLDELPSTFPYSSALVLLASDSSIRIFATKSNPEMENWRQMGSGGFGRGPEHICAIACTVLTTSSGGAVPVVACGSMGGSVSLVGLGITDSGGDSIGSTSMLKVAVHKSAVSYLAWLPDSQRRHPGESGVLAVGAADGTVQLLSVARDLTQASVVATISGRDWRPVTAHGVGRDMLLLAKLGQVMVVNLEDISSPQVRKVAVGVTQTIVSCVVDENRNRAYVGSYDFDIIVLARKDDQWHRALEEEAPLRDGMKKTVVRLFTTKFNMQRLFLRGMTMSPLGRYLAFVVE
ncbi:hypothetical protein LPJ70_004014 [Coemansia sp. RSA 2708]|nr:hypothetical protein LPJ70_004014 [Coemansia sp. RSA 2708]